MNVTSLSQNIPDFRIFVISFSFICLFSNGTVTVPSGIFVQSTLNTDRLCDLAVRVLGYRSSTHFLRSSGSGTGSTQPREYN
jgi:hypothetical protein